MDKGDTGPKSLKDQPNNNDHELIDDDDADGDDDDDADDIYLPWGLIYVFPKSLRHQTYVNDKDQELIDSDQMMVIMVMMVIMMTMMIMMMVLMMIVLMMMMLMMMPTTWHGAALKLQPCVAHVRGAVSKALVESGPG